MNLAISLLPKNPEYALSVFLLVLVRPCGANYGAAPNIGLHSCPLVVMSRCMASSSMKPLVTREALSCISQYGSVFPSWQQVPVSICFLLLRLLLLSIRWACQLRNLYAWARSLKALPQLRRACKPTIRLWLLMADPLSALMS